MKTPYEYFTQETVPANTTIVVSGCADCPFHNIEDETSDVCTHPELEPPTYSYSIKHWRQWPVRYFETRDNFQTFCPMLSRVKTTTVKVRDDIYQDPKAAALDNLNQVLTSQGQAPLE